MSSKATTRPPNAEAHTGLRPWLEGGALGIGKIGQRPL